MNLTAEVMKVQYLACITADCLDTLRDKLVSTKCKLIGSHEIYEILSISIGRDCMLSFTVALEKHHGIIVCYDEIVEFL